VLPQKASDWLINPLHSLDIEMVQELQAFSTCARGADLKEEETAFIEKRAPLFKGD
jgi:hypothetical protein